MMRRYTLVAVTLATATLAVGCSAPRNATTQAVKTIQPDNAATPMANVNPTPGTSQTLPRVTITTTMGEMVVELYAGDSPRTVKNFIQLAKSGFYDGTKFHRVIKGFMIQGGDPLSKEPDVSRWGTGGPGYRFDDEFNAHPLVRGSLAMANNGADTNGSQFFIVTADATAWLDGKHTNFGRVVTGMEVAEAIESAATDEHDRPWPEVVVKKMTVHE